MISGARYHLVATYSVMYPAFSSGSTENPLANQNRKSSVRNLRLQASCPVSNLDEGHWQNEYILNRREFGR